MINVNEVVLQGVIVHKYVTDKVAILSIATTGHSGTQNFPNVVFFGDLVKEVDEKYKTGDKVNIRGNIQSSKYDENIKNQSLLSVVGFEIRPYEGLIIEEFGDVLGDVDLTNKSGIEFENKFKVAGKLVRVRQFDNIVKFTVSAITGRRINYISLAYYTKSPEAAAEIIEKYKDVEQVFVVGTVQTSKKDFEDGTRYFSDFVVSAISA